MDLEFECPHCKQIVIVNTNELNCGIFRHAVLIKTGKQIDPHANEKICENYIKKQKIYGCGKPYQVIKEEGNYKAIICDYI